MFNTDVWTHPSPWQGSDYNIENYIKVESMSQDTFVEGHSGTIELTDVKTIVSYIIKYFGSGQDSKKGTTIYLKINFDIGES